MSIKNKIRNLFFTSSKSYWENRYKKGGNSGAGSYGDKALYKADFINRFIQQQQVQSVIEFGCGDGHQLQLLRIPSYLGYDISPTIIDACRKLYKEDTTKKFELLQDKNILIKADLCLSLDVIYHLVEDEVYENYMNDLFNQADKWVIIYAWDLDDKQKFHVRHRKFSIWISRHQPGFSCYATQSSIKGYCDFFVYQRRDNTANLD